MQTRGKRFALWVVLLLGTLLVVEGLTAGYFLLFARTYYRPLYLEKINNQHLWRTERHDWGAWHKPSSTASDTHNCYSVSYRSNSHGARDRERSVTAGTKRAVMLGDSFVEGFAVDEDRRLSNLLEKHLGMEILNFGMTHFGPLQYKILYEKLVKQFDHDAVIIGVLPENDFIDNDLDFARQRPDFARRYIPYYGEKGRIVYPRSRPSPTEPSPFADQYDRDNPEDRTVVQNLFRLFWVYGLYRDVRYNASVLRYPRAGSYVGYFETDAARIARVTDTLVAIRKSASPRPVLVVFFPDYKSWDYVVTHPGAQAKSTVAHMRGVLERRGVRTLDLLELWLDRGLEPEDIYLPCDGHWNEAGHRAAFEVVRPVVGDMLRHAALVRRTPPSYARGPLPPVHVTAPSRVHSRTSPRAPATAMSPPPPRRRLDAEGPSPAAIPGALQPLPPVTAKQDDPGRGETPEVVRCCPASPLGAERLAHAALAPLNPHANRPEVRTGESP